MAVFLTAIVGGLILLVWSADRFISGSAALARLLGVSPLVIGLTVVAFGTSAPEMFVSALSALQGQPGLAIGNALGSNITNIGLILGITAMVRPLTVGSSILRRELPMAAGLVLLSVILLLDGDLDVFDGVVLLIALTGLLIWLYRMATSGDPADPLASEIVNELPAQDMSLRTAVFWTVVGLILLASSAQILVWGAVGMAEMLGVPDLIIGLTIVALGTSLPELAASLAGALKGEHDLAIGNILGSNMFNLTIVLPMPALLSPGLVPPELLSRDMLAMVLFTGVLFLMAAGWAGRAGRINRIEAGVLLLGFGAYELILLNSSL